MTQTKQEKIVLIETEVSTPLNVPGDVLASHIEYNRVLIVIQNAGIDYEINQINHNVEQFNGQYLELITDSITFQILINDSDFERVLELID